MTTAAVQQSAPVFTPDDPVHHTSPDPALGDPALPGTVQVQVNLLVTAKAHCFDDADAVRRHVKELLATSASVEIGNLQLVSVSLDHPVTAGP